MATPMGLSCTLPPSCFTFFLPLLVSFVSRLGLVRLDSALLGPQPSLSLSISLPSLLSTTPPVIGLSIARAPSLQLCPSCTGPPAPSPPRRAPRLSATRVYIGPARWGFRQNDEQVKPTRPPPLPANPSRTRAHARNRDIGPGPVRGKRTERAQGAAGSAEGRGISTRSPLAHREGGRQKRRSIDESTHTYRRICQNKSPVFRRVTF